MDYEKEYKEALERARDVYTYYCDDREQLRKIESISNPWVFAYEFKMID